MAPYPPPFAGPETSAKLFMESEVPEKFNVRLLNTNFRASNTEKGAFGIAMFKAFFTLMYRLLRELASFRPHLVYYYVTATVFGWMFKDIWVILLSKLLGTKVVIHMRAGHFRSNFDSTNPFNQSVIKKVLNISDYSLAQSESLAEQYNGVIKTPSKYGHIYNMINLETFPSLNIDAFKVNSVFFMGHLSQAKGYCDILKAMPRVLKEFPDTTFYFAGAIIRKERNVSVNNVNNEPIHFEDPIEVFDKYIKGKHERNYQYLGMLDKEEKTRVLTECNMFVLPSYSEGFSMSVLEAISAGKPVITTPVGGLKDIVRDHENGLLIMPGDIEGLANAIMKLLGDKILRNQIARNNCKYRETFGTDRISKQYVSLFNKIL